MKKLFLAIVAVLSMVTMANALSYFLDEVNDNNTGTSGPWAVVTLTDIVVGGNDAVHFVVDPIDSAFSNLGTNFGLQSFYFNENTGFGSSLVFGNFSPGGWNYNYGGSYNAGGGFGKFEILANGSGSNRANPLSFDVYTNTNKTLNISDFTTTLSTEGYIFAAHIADYNNGNSAKFATDGPPDTIVPEPGTMLLLGTGLFGLAIFGKRRMSK